MSERSPDGVPGAERPSDPPGYPHDRQALIFDGLTGLYSIEYFEHQMRSEMAYALRHDMPLSLILIAVDYVEDLTKAFGAEARDRILLRVADQVREHVRTEDVLARYGLSMLALLFRGTPLEAAAFLGTRIRQSVESAALAHKGMELPITVSLGVATLSPGMEEHPAVVQNAERALAQARKRSNCVVVADDQGGG